jgi:predicted transcriptional regulator
VRDKSPKLRDPAVLFARIERVTHEALHEIAASQNRTMAAVVREALDNYVARRGKESEAGA